MLFLRALSQGLLVISLHEQVEKRVRSDRGQNFFFGGKKRVFSLKKVYGQEQILP